jgi:hypothetical protein
MLRPGQPSRRRLLTWYDWTAWESLAGSFPGRYQTFGGQQPFLPNNLTKGDAACRAFDAAHRHNHAFSVFEGKAKPISANKEATLKACIEMIDRYSPALYSASGAPTIPSRNKYAANGNAATESITRRSPGRKRIVPSNTQGSRNNSTPVSTPISLTARMPFAVPIVGRIARPIRELRLVTAGTAAKRGIVIKVIHIGQAGRPTMAWR